jgi:BirA family biotin operon repressor/biotin-[acetyl-CoA-carboxylase] ligase
MCAELLPDAVLPRLKTRWLGRCYRFERQVDSTNTQLERLGRHGAVHGTVLVGDAQTRGRGRLQRQWFSPGGANLYFSVLLRPSWDARQAVPVSLVAGVAVAEAVEPLLTEDPVLKWPNDVLFQGRKLAGILVEATMDGTRTDQVVLGIGLNVNQVEFPEPLANLAASLRQVRGTPLCRATVLVSVLARLEVWIDTLARGESQPIVRAWSDRAPWLGKRVTIRGGERDLTGTALGLGPRGELRLREATGRERLVYSGDVFPAS